MSRILFGFKGSILLFACVQSFTFILCGEESKQKFISYMELSDILAIQFKMSHIDWEKQRKEIEEIVENTKKNMASDKTKFVQNPIRLSKQKEYFANVSELDIYENWGKILNKVSSYRQDTGLQYPVIEALNDLEFFINNDGTARKTLFNTISRTETFWGEFVLASMLTNPLTDKRAIDDRREFISALSADSIIKKLQKRLSNVKILERDLAKWLLAKPEFIDLLSEEIGSSASGWNRLQSGMNFTSSVAFSIASIGALGVFISTFGSPIIPWQAAAVFVTSSLKSYEKAKYRDLMRAIHEFPIKMNSLLSELQGLQNDIKAIPYASSVLKNLEVLSKIKNNEIEMRASLKEAIASIKNNPKKYSGKGRYWTVSTPEIKKVFHQIYEARDDLGEIFEALGEIDAYTSIAQLLRENSQKNSAFFSLVAAIDDEKPIIELKGFWNPMIPRDKVVVNDISIGKEFNALVLTGSNTGGKSTLLKAILVNLLMGQGIGIACAYKSSFTPFQTIYSSMNISDNVSKDESLFMAEAKRAKFINDLAKNVPPNYKNFILMDELFTGTSSEKGEGAAVKFSESIFQRSNVLVVFATHFKKVTELAETIPNRVKNFKIEAVRDADGKIHRPFKLEEGVSTVNIADDILNREMGDDIDFN